MNSPIFQQSTLVLMSHGVVACCVYGTGRASPVSYNPVVEYWEKFCKPVDRKRFRGVFG
jgi:hypothetical protein